MCSCMFLHTDYLKNNKILVIKTKIKIHKKCATRYAPEICILSYQAKLVNFHCGIIATIWPIFSCNVSIILRAVNVNVIFHINA